MLKTRAGLEGGNRSSHPGQHAVGAADASYSVHVITHFSLWCLFVDSQRRLSAIARQCARLFIHTHAQLTTRIIYLAPNFLEVSYKGRHYYKLALAAEKFVMPLA